MMKHRQDGMRLPSTRSPHLRRISASEQQSRHPVGVPRFCRMMQRGQPRLVVGLPGVQRATDPRRHRAIRKIEACANNIACVKADLDARAGEVVQEQLEHPQEVGLRRGGAEHRAGEAHPRPAAGVVHGRELRARPEQTPLSA